MTSTSTFENVLSKEELEYFQNHPEVLLAKSSLDTKSSGKVYFSVPITDSIRASLQTRFNLSLPVDSHIPMRWIKGDTVPHVDTGASTFKNTYLVYLTDSPGELIVDSQSYPIQSNTGFVFNEGLSHETINTENVPRLMIGPMNEFVEPVGATTSYIFYFATEADALNTSNSIGSSNNYIVGDGLSSPYTRWKIASNSVGGSDENLVYNNGDTLDSELINNSYYFLYPVVDNNILCFHEDTKILTDKGYIPVKDLKKGALVKTHLSGFVPIEAIGHSKIYNPANKLHSKNRLYKCSKDQYPELEEDLILTGCHSILKDNLTENQREKSKEYIGDVYVTETKLRLIACLDDHSEPYDVKGIHNIWHFCLENEDKYMNYGCYANGLLVETSSIRMMHEISGMELVE